MTLLRIIELNPSLAMQYELEEKVRALSSERQQLFNEMYHLREQLD